MLNQVGRTALVKRTAGLRHQVRISRRRADPVFTVFNAGKYCNVQFEIFSAGFQQLLQTLLVIELR